MKAIHYLESLLPSFGKDQVIEDIRLTRNEVQDITLPAYETAVTLLKKYDFKSPEIKADMEQFKRVVKNNTIGFAHVVEKALSVSLDNLDEVEEMIKKQYNEEVAGLGMTYLKTAMLQLVECIGFVSKYARKYLVYIYVCETAQYEESETTIAESMAPAELEWLRLNFLSFCTALNIVSTPRHLVKRSIQDIPDVVVTKDNSVTLGSTLGESKLDPLQMRLIPVWLNPIYHVGMFVAEWQASRYKSAQEELKLLQLRKLNLQRLSEGKPDAKIQKEIAYMESRVQGINAKIAKMEKEHG